MSNVVHLPSSAALRTPIGHLIRAGEAAYKQVENLHAEGRLPAKGLIVDGSKARFQKEFIQTLRSEGAEIVLDTKVAELSELGRYGGAAKDAPWAIKEEHRPLRAQDFEMGSNLDLYGKIARCAVELEVTAILAPTHFLREGANDPWFDIDVSSVGRLRRALDREGGSGIAIDYPLIMPHTKLQDGNHRSKIIQTLRAVSFDNIMVRLSGFGASAPPLSVKHTLLALGELSVLQRPVILDHVGGLVGLSAVAFGFASGVAHGIGEHDSFDARNWHKVPPARDANDRFGRAVYIPIPDFDRSFSAKDLKKIASCTGGRRLVSCHDRRCCPQAFVSMIDRPRAHIAYQKFRAMGQLFAVPDTRRVGHFLQVEMRDAERKAGDLARLNTGDDRLNNALLRGRKRIDHMARMYETLAESNRTAPPPPVRRTSANSAASRGAK